MRFNLILHTAIRNAMLPANYQYPLASAIYKIIARADAGYATFLHEQGYPVKNSLKSFKLFTFSDLRTPFRNRGDRLLLTGNEASFTICFHIANAAENFIRGLFMDQKLEIADRVSKVIFQIREVESQSVVIKKEEVLLQPISSLVCGRKNEKENYDFLAPSDKDFCEMLLLNWQEKIKSVYEVPEEALKQLTIEPVFYKNPPRSRLITIKADTPAETKIRGFMNFKIKVGGEKHFIELLMNSGMGLYNAMGMGCMEKKE